MSTVFTSTEANNLLDTLDAIVDDETDNMEAQATMPKIFDVRSTKKAFVDILEMGGLGPAQEIAEGAEIQPAGINEGAFTRLWVRKWGLRAMATEEALDDGQDEQVVKLARRLKRSMWQAVDIDAANIFSRANDPNYVGGDGVCLASASHTIPGGGTWSNLMATATAPSEAAYIIARAQADELPGHDGVSTGVEITGVTFPVPQRAAWEILSFTEKSPLAGEFNKVNLVNRDGIKTIMNRHWYSSDTDFAFLTNAEDGLVWYWRRRPNSKTWLTNAQDIMNYSITGRWARGWGDPRCVIYSDN